MIYHYIEYRQDGSLKHIGIEADKAGTSFVTDKNMMLAGLAYRAKACRDLKNLADALIAGGNTVEGMERLEELLKDYEEKYEAFKEGSKEQ